MYMRKGQTKDYYIRHAEETDRQNRELRDENRKITSAMFGILKTKEELKVDAAKEVEADVDALKKECDSRLDDMAEEMRADRERLLTALGIDETEWERIAWRY